jgi:hypothetical protein
MSLDGRNTLYSTLVIGALVAIYAFMPKDFGPAIARQATPTGSRIAREQGDLPVVECARQIVEIVFYHAVRRGRASRSAGDRTGNDHDDSIDVDGPVDPKTFTVFPHVEVWVYLRLTHEFIDDRRLDLIFHTAPFPVSVGIASSWQRMTG